MKLILVAFMLTSFSTAVVAQPGKDACHVFVVDLAKAKKTSQALHKAGDKEAESKALTGSQTVYPEFRPVNGDEQLTTQHYPFPDSEVVITASVYYTGKSMTSRSPERPKVNPNSIVIGILLHGKKFPTALSDFGGSSVMAEATYDEHTNKIRAKKYLRVDSRPYLVGIECECGAKEKAN